MPERKYSVAEIERMRAIIGHRLNGQFYPGEHEGIVEDRLRTHMLNGTTPDELDPERLFDFAPKQG